MVKEVRSNCYVTLPSVKNQSENMQSSNNLSEINRGLNVLRRPEFTTRNNKKKNKKSAKRKSLFIYCSILSMLSVEGNHIYYRDGKKPQFYESLVA